MTTGTVPKSRLVEFAQPVRREITIDPTGAYRTVGCHLYGKGVYERETKAGVEIKANRMFLIEKDDLVINRIWAQKGSAGIVPESLASAVVTQDLPVWALDPERAFPPYIGWYLKTPDFWEECRRHSHGTSGRERLSPKELPNVMFPLPPLDEQRRIVARIGELAALIEEARELRVKAREEVEALIPAAQTELFTAPNIRTSVKAKLRETTTKIGSGSTPRGGRSVYVESGIPFIRSMNVLMNKFSTDGLAFITPETDKAMTGTRVYPSDVLLNITGASIGRVCCVPESIHSGNVNQHVSIIRPTPDLEPRFVMYWLSQPNVQQEIMDIQKGATRQALTKAQIESFEIPALPLSEQRRIVACLDDLQAQVDELTALQDATQAELDALLPSVLDRAFRGEL